MKFLRFFGRPRKPSLIFVRRVAGQSMLPLLAEGQLIAGFAGRRRISIGDLVVFRHEGLDKIKRVQAVDPARVFVVGDNRLASTDSYDFGWIERSAIIGRVYWPLRTRAKKCKNAI